MEEEHSFAAKRVRPVWSPSEAAPERSKKKVALLHVHELPAGDVHLLPPMDLPSGFLRPARSRAHTA